MADCSGSAEYSPFCQECVQKMLAGSGESCPRCGADVGKVSNAALGCPACRNERLSFSRVWRFGPYEGLIKETVLKCKLPKGEILAEAAGWLIAQALSANPSFNRPDAIVPVPTHWTKWFLRGHNPAHGIAIGLSKVFGVPCRPQWLRKIRPTPSQTSLTPTARRMAPRNAFRGFIPSCNRDATIWLVDDVLTTGATASACAKALLEKGASEVVAIVLARGG